MRTHSLGALVAVFACTAALAAPLPVPPDAAGPPRGAARVVPDEELLGFEPLLVDTSARLGPTADAGVVPLRLRFERPTAGDAALRFDTGQAREPFSDSLPMELLSQPNVPQPRAHANARSNDPGRAPLIDIAREEWFQELAQSLLAPALRIETDEQGRRSVSLFGPGGPGGSTERPEVVFSPAEAQIPLQALRATAYERADDGAGLFPAAEGPDARRIPPLPEVVQWLIEVASHPLSLLAYCIVAAYVLLWSMPSHRRTHPARARNRRRRKRSHASTHSVREGFSEHRSRSSGRSREAAAADAAPASPRGERSRERRRRRGRRRRSQQQAA